MGGLAESKEESDLEMNQWVCGSGTYRPYTPYERVWT